MDTGQALGSKLPREDSLGSLNPYLQSSTQGLHRQPHQGLHGQPIKASIGSPQKAINKHRGFPTCAVGTDNLKSYCVQEKVVTETW